MLGLTPWESGSHNTVPISHHQLTNQTGLKTPSDIRPSEQDGVQLLYHE